MVGIFGEMVPPNVSPRRLDLLYSGILESVAMSVVATVAGVVLSIPIGFITADNIVPKPIYLIGRGFIVASRSLHELIVAIIAVKAFGIGAFAGVFTLVFGTVGFYSKLLTEDIEDIDSTQVDAIRSTGAGGIQTVVFAVLPQVLPRMIGLTVYRWDINIRHSTVVGIVGAGSVGATLMNSFNTYELDFSLTIIIAIVAIVLLGEGTSALIRRRIN
jgi:phosphonate transport system permease protein